MRIRLPPAIALLASLLGAVPAAAGGFHISVIGGRRNGMLANLAAPDDVTAVFHNPAALGEMHGLRLELFGSGAFLSNEFRLQALDPERFPEINPRGCGSAGRPECPWPIGADGTYVEPFEPESTFGVLPFVGVSTDLGWLSEGLRDVGVGLAVYAPNFYGGVLAGQGPPAYFMTEGYFLVVATTAGVGWRLHRTVSVGFNVSYEYMRLAYGQRLSFLDALTEPASPPSTLGRAVQEAFGDALLEFDGVDHGVGWGLSVLVRPAWWLAFGATYGGSTSAAFDGPLSLRPTREGVDSFDDLEALGVDLPRGLRVEMPIPPSLGLGVAVLPAPWIEIGFDCRLWFYQLYTRQTIRPVYAADAAGIRPLTEESLSRPRRYDLSYELALGVLFRPVLPDRDLEILAGVGYDRSPVPDEHFSLDNPSLSTVLLSAGARWRLDEHWRATVAYIGMIYVERDVRGSVTSPPTNVRGGGHNHMPSIEVEYRF